MQGIQIGCSENYLAIYLESGGMLLTDRRLLSSCQAISSRGGVAVVGVVGVVGVVVWR